jgi:hypothetical protein
MQVYNRNSQIDQILKVIGPSEPLAATPFTYIYGIKHTGKTCSIRSTLLNPNHPANTKYYYVDASVHAAYSLRLFLEHIIDLFSGHVSDVDVDYSPSRRCGSMLEFTIALAEICADKVCRYLVYFINLSLCRSSITLILCLISRART